MRKELEKLIDEAKALTLPADKGGIRFDLNLDALDRAQVSAGEKDIRFYLNGVAIQSADGGRLIGTNGNMLIAIKARVPAKLGEIIMPDDMAYGLACSEGETAAITYHEKTRMIVAQVEEGVVARHAVDGKFPDWRRVLTPPPGNWGHVSFDVRELEGKLRALRQSARALTDGKKPHLTGATFDAKTGKITMPKLRATLPITRSTIGGSYEAAAGTYALELMIPMASAMTDDARWMFTANQRKDGAIHIASADADAVIMSMRTQAPASAAQQKPVEKKAPPKAPAQQKVAADYYSEEFTPV